MQWRRYGVLLLATGGFLGKIPVGPGTFGSLLGLLLCWPVSRLSPVAQVLAMGALAAVAVAVAGEAERILNRTDPGQIVIDEIAGMVLTLLLVPFNAVSAAGGFVLFRILDIAKPFPIRFIERRLTGGIGVVADDLAAGLIANLLLRLLTALFFPDAA